jgi:hypothetical protein
MAIKRFLSTVLFVSIFSFLIFPSQDKAFPQFDGNDQVDGMDFLNWQRGVVTDSSIKINYKTTATSPTGCDLEIYDYPGIYSASDTCLIELKSTECRSGQGAMGNCSASVVLAIDLKEPRAVNHFKSLTAPPSTGTCYHVTQTNQTNLEFSRLGTIRSKLTGELCVLSDEPGLPGVVIYSDLNGIGEYWPEGRVVPSQVKVITHGVVMDDENGQKRDYFIADSFAFPLERDF